MKRSSLLLGVAAGLITILVLALLAKLTGLIHPDMAPPQAWGHEQGRHGFREAVHAGHDAGGLTVISVILRMAVVAIGAAFFFKTKRLSKWLGAFMAAIALISLITPFGGIMVIAIVIWLAGRMKKNNDKFAAANLASFPMVSDNRGQILDEWERSQSKEDN